MQGRGSGVWQTPRRPPRHRGGLTGPVPEFGKSPSYKTGFRQSAWVTLEERGQGDPRRVSKPGPRVKGFANLEFHRQLLEHASTAGGRGFGTAQQEGEAAGQSSRGLLRARQWVPLSMMLPEARPGLLARSFKELVPSLNCLAFLAQKAAVASAEQSPQLPPPPHMPSGNGRNSGVGWA